ncbi:MAG: CoB--CoM heterodisulfide reductase iron-sulfur subunit B family protein [Pseudomonadota bacterium]
MTYGYYPGCSSHGTAKEYDISTKKVCEKLGLKLEEVRDWNCCGASPAHATSEELALALPFRNLVLAEKQGLDSIMSTCSACYNRLKVAHETLKKDPETLNRISEIVGEPYNKALKVIHFLELISKEFGLEKIKENVVKPLEGLKAVSYYGCLLTRPPDLVSIDPDDENPTIMEDIIEALGAESPYCSHKTECCGASFALDRTDIVLRLSNEILKAARFADADCIVVACPLCFANLDMRQSQIASKYGVNYSLPILFISELMGIAMGMGYKELGLDKHIVSAKDLLKRKNLI